MLLDINRRQSKFVDLINTSKLTLKAHECGERIPIFFSKPVGSMGLTGAKKCPYNHTWQRTMNSIEISWSADDKLIMMREKSQLGQL